MSIPGLTEHVSCAVSHDFIHLHAMYRYQKRLESTDCNHTSKTITVHFRVVTTNKKRLRLPCAKRFQLQFFQVELPCEVRHRFRLFQMFVLAKVLVRRVGYRYAEGVHESTLSRGLNVLGVFNV